MRPRTIAIGALALALVGVGAWLLDRSRSATASHASARSPVPAATNEVASSPRPSARVRPPTPTLVRPTTPIAPGLEADLTDASARVRREAIRELALDRDADPAALVRASRDPDPSVAALATDALGKLHAEGRVPAKEILANATNRSLDERVRAVAFNAVGVVPSAETAHALVDALARGSVFERRVAAVLLAHQDPEAVVSALIDALGDADEVVRDNALNSLRARSRGRDFGSDAAAWRAWWQSRSR